MTLVWAGLSLGAVYALVATMYTVTMLTSSVFNFAQAQLVMLGTFVAYVGLQVWRLPFLLTVLLGGGVVALVAVAEERVAVRSVARRGGHGTLVTTIGAAVVMSGAVFVVAGTDAHRLPAVLPDETVTILGGRAAVTDIALIVSAVLLSVGLQAAYQGTTLGLRVRAAVADHDAAQMRGVDVRRVSTYGFALAGALAGVSGWLIGAKTLAVYNTGDALVLLAFVAMAFGGGFQNFLGSLVGGLTIGMVYVLSARYLGSNAPLLVMFVLLLSVLLVKPGGLLGARSARFV